MQSSIVARAGIIIAGAIVVGPAWSQPTQS